MNKINNKHLFYLCFSLLFVLTGCSENEIIEQSYLRLSENSFTFEPEGKPLTIRIEANPAWNIVPDDEYDWLTEKERGADFITFTAADNMANNARSATFTVTAGMYSETIQLDQLPAEIPFAKYRLLDKLSASTISLNGKYIGGSMVELDDKGNYVHTIVRIDTETGEEVIIEKTDESLDVNLVSNTGIVVVYSGELSHCVYYTAPGERHAFELNEGYRTPYINGMNGDGSVMVGYVRKEWGTFPAKWVNGKFEALPIPELDINGDEMLDAVEARGCSEDGSVIYGGVQNVHTAVYWKDGKVEYMGKDVINPNATIIIKHFLWGEMEIPYTETLFARTKEYGISPNGRYIAAYYGVSEDKKEKNYPAIFDIVTETTTVIREFPNNKTDGGEAIGVTDEGDIFYGTFEIKSSSPLIRVLDEGFVYEAATQQNMRTRDYLKKSFGITLQKDNALLYRVCTDKKTIYGENFEIGPMGFMMQGWYIKLPE